MYEQLVISDIREEIKDVRTISFSAATFSYKAGQYLTLVKKSGEQEVRRSYSIVSSPLLNEPLSICVKRIENGVFSRYLVDEAKVGDVVLSTGTGGFFTLPDDLQNYKQLFLLAGGSGIAPNMSLLKTALHSHPELDIVLIYSSRSKSDTIYYEQLQQLAREHPSLHVEYLLSNTKQLLGARLHQILLKKLLQQYAQASYQDILFYICGPFSYMRMITYTLAEEHVPERNVRKENFNASKPVVTKEPPDKDAHLVRISINGQKHSFEMQYPDTILKAAQRKGLSLPYSCEVGRCGNCAARCIKGKVWMSYNEVLTDREVSNGLVLTCTGYAVEGDIELVIE
jgi:ring-1,2-phenylacetyl-CoA epoxidase subunit PaaE